MSMILKTLAIFAVSYVIGSLSLSIIVSGGLFGKDIRSFGSGNAGATNMARVFGWSAGILTLLGDAAKAVLCMVLGNLWLGDLGLSAAAFGSSALGSSLFLSLTWAPRSRTRKRTSM